MINEFFLPLNNIQEITTLKLVFARWINTLIQDRHILNLGSVLNDEGFGNKDLLCDFCIKKTRDTNKGFGLKTRVQVPFVTKVKF